MSRILDVLAEDREVIAYRPKLRAIAGSALGSILLQQILHRAKNNRWKPFWKFTAPCDNEDCRPGDSWLEELGFTLAEFDLARSAIATKIMTGMSKHELLGEVLIFYWTDSTRKTWYEVNQPLLANLLDELYTDDNAKPLIANYIVMRRKHITRKRHLSGLYNPSEIPEISKISETPVSEDESENEQSKPNLTVGGKVLNLPPSIRDSIEHPAHPKTFEPTTPLAKYLAEQSTYGNRKWQGFATAGERDDWMEMEKNFSPEDIKSAINWACKQMRFGKNKLVGRIISAVNNNREAKANPGKVAHDTTDALESSVD